MPHGKRYLVSSLWFLFFLVFLIVCSDWVRGIDGLTISRRHASSDGIKWTLLAILAAFTAFCSCTRGVK